MTLSSKILDLIPVACFHLDEQGCIDYVNFHTETLCAKKRTELLGFNFWEVFPAWKSSPMFQALEKTSAEQQPITYEFFSDLGSEWIKLTASPEEDGIILVFNPSILTEELDSRSVALKKSEERFRVFVSASSDMVYEMSADWAQLYQLKGKEFLADTEEVTSDWIQQYIPEKEQPRVLLAIKEAIDNKAIFELEHEVLAADGSIGWTCSRAIPILNKQGEIIEWFGTAKDLTAIKEAERKIRYMEICQQQEIVRVTLNAQEEERRRVSESLHNGLGQLLYAVKLSINYLGFNTATDTPEEFNTAKNYTCDLLNEAIKACRTLSHELMPTVLAEFGLKEALSDLCNQMNEEITYKCHVELEEINLDKFMEIAVFRIVQELVFNVIKHAEATLLSVDVVIENDLMVMRVKDNGRGFPIEKVQDSGIGLSSIRVKTALLNGTFQLSSMPGQGSIIEVKIPLNLINDVV
ncbi:PAS domain-containing protein [Pedobacter sp. N36a]|uniref:PAS domain-containing sensor histidine kinase n=1 Tax=Pedobacter sp. N36a TaxID=2767996 RepID=UPI0016569FE0|nr:ATP-binding protein [Pedobacter sp. N36a]MBC8984943.1 PAS domain-containing protein [Pedobacter sp. N36a]